MCSSKKLCENDDCQICFEKSFASHEKSKYWSDKNQLKPRQVFKASNKEYLFDCKCGHEFETVICDVTGKNDRWCPFCAQPARKLCNNNCEDCFKKSFASHEKSKYWSNKNELIPREVFKGSHVKYWFDCDKCGHNFETSINSITRINDNTWCPFCTNQKLCDNNDCQQCFEKSFASHEKSKYWSDKNEVKPREMFKGTTKKYWFNCDQCTHEFDTSLANIKTHNRWCPFCTNQKLCDNNNCESCFEKSFASYEKSNQWSDKNKVIPRQVFKCTNKKFWFNCNDGHEFEIKLYAISRKNGGCSICVNKTEKKLYEQLLIIYHNINRQFRTDWCKNPDTNRHLPFDFVLEDQKIIIELDGPQHFVQVSTWKSPEEQTKSDQYKEKSANENGYSIIRLLQEDVLHDRYDWLTELKENIIKIINEASVQNIYMCKNNEYSNFIA